MLPSLSIMLLRDSIVNSLGKNLARNHTSTSTISALLYLACPGGDTFPLSPFPVFDYIRASGWHLYSALRG